MKDILRANYRSLRKAIPGSYQKEASALVCSRVHGMAAYQSAKRIALYQAIHQEVDPCPLWQIAVQEGRLCYFPVLLEDKTLAFMPATTETPFRKNQYQILEPEGELSTALPVEELHIMLLPLLAFDQFCRRIGMGGGYYDRTLANKKRPFLIGLAYELQRHTKIDPDPWDVPLDAVVTEKTTYWRSKS